jgi:hypothetical protein
VTAYVWFALAAVIAAIASITNNWTGPIAMVVVSFFIPDDVMWGER